MPRPTITTVLTPRTKPTTEYIKPRDTEDPISFDSTEITFDSTLFTWDQTGEGKIETLYNTPRYNRYLEDILGANVFDLSGNQVVGISGSRTNKIDTFYT